MINPFINNEYSLIKKVVLGIANNFGGTPTIEDAYDPKSKQNILNKSFPIESQLINELNTFEQVLNKYDVHVLVCPTAFKNQSDLDIIKRIYSNEKLILISENEMYNMVSNIFSISNNIIISDVKFSRLNNLLINKGYNVETISFSETFKMGGLFRCATLPLERL